MTPHLYLDEDCINRKLIRALRQQNFGVTTTPEAARLSESDERQLEFATEKGWILVSHNIKDFAELHSVWISQSRSHGGLILIQQDKFSIGEQVRRIQKALAQKEENGMSNELIYLTSVL